MRDTDACLSTAVSPLCLLTRDQSPDTTLSKTMGASMMPKRKDQMHFSIPEQDLLSLQLQLDAFLFPQDTRNSIFITCQLKATSEMRKSSPVNKACNYINSRWINVDGSDDVCRCCDDTCSSNSPTGQTNLGSLIPEDLVARETVTLGPLMVLPIQIGEA
ncbi:zona pellucida sperm-binding protein 3-like [Trematomus bernacchii]|uniref:zona pellucida sperm-binding protein 3-like n=1 Tax=Trematomus bernacchii TaxID=40690 RepID=UPI00146B08DB|nr:zona pellucida sperm-binding protein 3-like [Trematomus bernacchii]